MLRTQVGLVAAGVLMLASGSAVAAEYTLGLPSYAEGIYSRYAAGTGGQLSFEVKTLDSGSLKQIAEVPLGQLVAPAGYMITADEVGAQLQSPRFVSPFATGGYDLFLSTELKHTPRDFERTAGYAVEHGTYRKLLVSATLASETRQHEALELCWLSAGRCTVFDPAVMFMESVIKNREELLAQGSGPTVTEEKAAQDKASAPGTAATCGLASNPANIGRSLTWGAYTRSYYNALGGLLIRKNLGGQQAGVRCNSSCYPAPFGYSNISSCQGFLGWSCACDNDFGYGISSRTGKWIAETKCTHKFAFSASASASVTNFGSASVSINWSLDGTTDGNGGFLADTCGYF